jgi:hypothetical protein
VQSHPALLRGSRTLLLPHGGMPAVLLIDPFSAPRAEL